MKLVFVLKSVFFSFLTFIDLFWPWNKIVQIYYFNSFIFTYKLISSKNLQNVTFSDLFPEFLTLSDPQKLLWKRTLRATFWLSIWSFSWNIEIAPNLTFFGIFDLMTSHMTQNDLTGRQIFWLKVYSIKKILS